MNEPNYPPWLNSKFFEEIFKKNCRGSSIKVRQFRIEPCGQDGFLSTLLRAHVNYSVNSQAKAESFILKMETNHELAIATVGANGFDVQNKEMEFFEHVAPRMLNILGEIGENNNFVPRMIGLDRETHRVILLEDLKVRNFVTIDRMIGLDEKRTQLGLQKLAKFHAASLIIKHEDPKAFNSFDTGLISRKIDCFNFYFYSTFAIAAAEIKTWPGFDEYAFKMEKMQESFIERLNRCFDNDAGDFCVLNHGDLWTNNLMFEDKDGKIDDVILVSLASRLRNHSF